MGNQLTAIAPSQILPVEQFLSECPDWKFELSLGSTRFFKVAKVRTSEGPMIVKVFVVHDLGTVLKGYKAQIEKMKSSLNWVLNCSPFHSIVQTDKAVMLCRRFVDSSLYDRISTKPFLTLIEKKWIAFLLLNALNQCHKLSIFHGDIKSENVLITSWNWVLLTDFANFKPTFLPDNNPADFSYYFDTSNRRACYIAPERFVEAGSVTNYNPYSVPLEPMPDVQLTAAMDVFSIGCVLIELFTEGDVPFNLSQLLAYRAGEYYPQKLIDSIEDEGIRRLVEQMIQLDPGSRLEIDKYLANHSGSTFPEIFYLFLKPYCQRFASPPFLNADERIARLKRDFDLITQKVDCYADGKEAINDGFLIVLPIIISSIGKLQLLDSKLHALDLFCSFSLHLSSDIIINHVIPSVLVFARDRYPIIRCEMLRTLNFCFLRVNTVSSCDSNLFTEYIFPSISHLANDSNLAVRIDFACYIASFAEHAHRCLELIWLQSLNEEEQSSYETQEEIPNRQLLYEMELKSLREVVQQTVVQLFGDKENCVKMSLLDSDFEKLCVFFGRHKICDIIFSHMITFLNDKQDHELRAAFFKKVDGVIALLGWHYSDILKPLLQQGLSDSEECNVSTSLSCMATLIELGLLQKHVVIQLLDDVVPLLYHPNIWIRKDVIWVLVKLSKALGWVDEQCYILPALLEYLAVDVYTASDGAVLLNSLKPPLPMQIYRQLARSSAPLETFLEFLGRSSPSGEVTEVSEENAILLRKLESQGMTEDDKRKIVLMGNHLKGLHRYKVHELSVTSNVSGDRNVDRNRNIIELRYSVDLARQYDYRVSDITSLLETLTLSRGKGTNRRLKTSDLSMNEDWRQMFGPELNAANIDKATDITRKDDQTCLPLTPSDAEPRKKIIQESLTRPIIAPNKAKLETLLKKKREQYLSEKATFDSMEEWRERNNSQSWRPRGIMVAHLHEHRGAVNRLCGSSDGMHFASCSNDGSVKVWDATRFDGKSITNRSRMTYSKQTGQLKSLCFCDKSQSLASSSDTGTVHLFRVDAKNESILEKKFNPIEDGVIVDMTTCDAGSESVIILATSYGRIIGWDIRSPAKYAWKVQKDHEHGLITSLDAHKQLGWFAVATCRGVHICWDRRFLLPVNTFTHPNGSRVRRMIVDKNAQSVVLSSSHSNNELTIFDFETSTRQKTLWASPTPVLGYAQSTKHYFGGIHADSSYVITAGSDMRLRYWDLKMPRDSYIIIGSSYDSKNVGKKVSYHSRLIEATAVIYEAYENQKTALDEPRSDDCDISVGHRNIITDLIVCSSSQQYIVTSTQDGIVKVWK